MSRLLIFSLLILSQMAYGQKIYTVDSFSKDFYGKVYIEKNGEVFSPGWIAIYNRKTNKELLKVVSEELAPTIEDGKIKANIQELPYGEQSLIIYNDFNFDGIKDLAIEDGQNSCYHGPSFRIYLASGQTFVFNADFTRLAQEYCGMFDVNYKEKKISTMTKDGCCWHEVSEFIVENNKPKVIYIQTEEHGLPYSTTTKEKWDGKKMIKTTSKGITLDEEGITVVFSFKLEKNEKEVLLFNINDRTLNYALTQKNGNVEFSYPLETVSQNADFTFSSTKTEKNITFKNQSATYKIYSSKDSSGQEKIGVEVSVDGKIYDLKGSFASKKGSLDLVYTPKLDNVVFR